MFGVTIYVIIQIAVLAFAVYIFVNRRELRKQNAHRTDPGWQKVTMLAIVPLLAFGYGCLDGFPPKKDRLLTMIVGTLVMYLALVFRWRRQGKASRESATLESEPLYYYRTSSGNTRCGPDTKGQLAALVRMGLIGENTEVSSQQTPDEWKALKDHAPLADLSRDSMRLDK